MQVWVLKDCDRCGADVDVPAPEVGVQPGLFDETICDDCRDNEPEG